MISVEFRKSFGQQYFCICHGFCRRFDLKLEVQEKYVMKYGIRNEEGRWVMKYGIRNEEGRWVVSRKYHSSIHS